MDVSLQETETAHGPVPHTEPAGMPPPGAPDIEIARAVKPRRILALAEERLGLSPDALVPYGHYKAKVSLEQVAALRDAPRGKLVLVTATNPTPAGEGKTTTSVGLNDGLNRIGLRSTVCLREPSLGPCFGMKGGAAGGGRAQIIPMEDINLHFNGDFHAITTAHNLLAAMLDNHLHWGNKLDIDPRQCFWRRAMDMNDRSLRNIIVGAGGTANGVPRETGFDITAASEIMAILCLADDLADLQWRLGNIVVAQSRHGVQITARDLGADGAMAALLRDALAPNLVQSLEHNPAFVHGGPFGNIAHGCNSVTATRTALALNDVVVTEAGFGADLGAEKFLDIKCRHSGLRPDGAVLVSTVKSLKMHGGVPKKDLDNPDADAVRRGADNLARHVANLRRFGLEPVVAVNRHPGDTEAELDTVLALCAELGLRAVTADHWARGGEGTEALAEAVQEALAGPPPEIQLLYEDAMPLAQKLRTVATSIYGADDIALSVPSARSLKLYEAQGYGHLPVCIAKTQYSFSSDPNALGAPTGHTLPVREVRLSGGAGFVVAVCGDVMMMPGLPRGAAAERIGLDSAGWITGLA
ncbi:formate--tetrahydrofolate ligase [Ectothiorhodospiraceae bacterium WFHF3C12]|nr:formate--tetrahydrofolate ligase [Ectothiorhodospiraceae bacterium WFHF3C12]